MNRLFEVDAFVLVVDEGSFTAAARRLDVTKSYVSKIVSRLEERLGVRLLQRSTRQLSLTEAGRAYYERCVEVLRALEQAETAATELQARPRGRLRLAVPSAFGVSYLVHPLAEFKAMYPELTVEAIFSDRCVDLVAEGFDLAIRVGELPDTGLVARRLATANRLVCAGAAYLERRGEPVEPEDLASHECLRYAYHTTPGTWRLRGPRGQVGVEVSGSLISNQAEMLVEAACQGLGIVLIPAFVAAAPLRDGRLRRVLPAWRGPAFIHAVFPAARHLPAKVRIFVDFLAEQLRDPPWAGCGGG